MTLITRFIFVRRTTDSTTNTINILITFRTVFSKINAYSNKLCINIMFMLISLYFITLTSPKHAANVGMPFIEPFLHNGIDERAAMKQHSFSSLMTVFFRNFLSSMHVAFPQFSILNLLNLKNTERR